MKSVRTSDTAGASPRLGLRRTRRGWMVAAMAALATAGGFAAGDFAAADGNPAACDQTTTTSTIPYTVTDPATGAVVTCQLPASVSDTTTSSSTTGTTTTDATTTTTTEAPPAPPAVQEPSSGDAPAPPTSADPAPPAADPAPPAAEQAPAAGDHPAPTAKPDHAGAVQPAATTDGSADPGAVTVAKAPAADHTAHAKTRHHRAAAKHHAAKRDVSATGTAAPSDQQYYPSVTVDWGALTPLAPPAFPGSAAQSFPGPQFLLPIFQAASVQYNVPWQVLAAINEVETDWGHNQGPSSAGAIGWMQFMPATWKTYGLDANGDGYADPGDPVDAIFSAAYYLHKAGADKDLGKAIFAYNHSDRYVNDVVQRAIYFGTIPEDLLTALTEQGRGDGHAVARATGSHGLLDRHARINSVGRAMLLGDKRLQKRILHDPNISIYPCGREDIAHGIIDRRILEVLQFLAAHRLKPTVSALECGHSFYTTSGNVSEHSSGDAVDIAAINGIPIVGHQGPGSITEKTIKELLKLGGGMRPHQIISLMTFAGADNTLSLPDHYNHIHVGFRPMRKIAGL